MALFLYLTGLLGAIIAWVYLFLQTARGSIKKDISFFIFHLAGCLASIFVLWLIMVYPSECSGLFCEVAMFLVWLALGSIIFLAWPLVLFAVFKNRIDSHMSNENLIDNEYEGKQNYIKSSLLTLIRKHIFKFDSRIIVYFF